ncbi:hypothetical protein RUM43_006662 [Polyplax serrata]|uniref:Protein Abitram n=1 Tax=Polyplax serrata TaxID=468196 RepID=A0AAN8RVK0_POLSC
MARFIPSIEDSFEKLKNYPKVTDRYYSPYYYINDKGSPTEHHCVLLHTNKICLITLAPSHPVVKEKKTIVHLDFQVTSHVDRLENKVRGKGKKGAQHLMPDSVLCYIICTDGTKYSVFACVKGKLLEINQMLLKNPNLMTEKPTSEGFIAIVLPSLKDLEVCKSSLLTEDKYCCEI